MVLRMYQPDEIQDIESNTRFYFDNSNIYFVNLKSQRMKKYQIKNEAVSISYKRKIYVISTAAIKLWTAGMHQKFGLFQVHNATMMVRLNNEPVTWDTVEKYL